MKHLIILLSLLFIALVSCNNTNVPSICECMENIMIQDTSGYKYLVNPPSAKFDSILLENCQHAADSLSEEEKEKRMDEMLNCDNITEEWKQMMQESYDKK